MLIKILSNGRSATYECNHIQVTYADDFTEIELCPSGRVLKLPDDGDTVFQMNDYGDTQDRYRWPPRLPQDSAERQV